MNGLVRHRLTGLVAGLCVLVAVGTPVGAAPAGFQDFAGGLQVLSEQWPPPQHFKTEYDQPTIIRYMLNLSWDRATDDLCSAIKDQIGKPGAVMKGQTLYDITCSMASSDKTTLRIKDELANGDVQLEYYVPGNYLEFTSTQPTVAGKWADPRFSVTYDLDLVAKLVVNGPPGLTADSATVYVRNSNIDSHGVVADVVLDFAKALKATLGTDFKGMGEAAINSQKVSFKGLLQKQLDQVNALLKGFASQGYTQMYGKLDGGALRLFLVGKTFAVPTSGPGVIAGAIRWRKLDGHPQDAMAGCQTLKVQVLAAAGYVAPNQFAAPSVPVGAVQMGPVYSQVGDKYECTYKATNLPLDVAMVVQVTMVGPWAGGGGSSVIPRPVPSGWIGTITVHQGSASDQNVRISNLPANNRSVVISTASGGGSGVVRKNPTGTLVVSGIDFDLMMQQAPR